MKTNIAVKAAVAGLAILGLTGCGGEDVAQKYAAQLAIVLKSYQAQVDKQLAAQVDTYRKLAQDLDTAAGRDVLGSLDTERAEREIALRDQLLDPNPRTRLRATSTSLRGVMLDYAEHEYATNKQVVTAELDGYKRFLAGIQDLQQESINIAQLRKLLEDLSVKKAAWTHMKEVVSFGQSVKDNFDKLQCDAAKADVTRLTHEISGFDEKIKAAQTDKDRQTLEDAKKSSSDDLKKAQEKMTTLSECK